MLNMFATGIQRSRVGGKLPLQLTAAAAVTVLHVPRINCSAYE